MSDNNFSLQGYLIRLVFALILVFATYNPSGYSFYHWAMDSFFGEALSIKPLFVLFAVVLIIGWTIYLRATFRSLGAFGLTLALCFFGAVVWWLIDIGLIGLDSVSVITYIVLVLLGAILAIGMSWSHIRRKMSGQADMDDVDD